MTSTRSARRKRTAKPRTFQAAQNTVVAGMYLRISKDEAGDRKAVTRHRRECMALLKASGWHVTEDRIYVDNDASATSGDPRPEFDRLLADVEAGRLNALVAWHVDRIYRTTTDLLRLCRAVVAAEEAHVSDGLRVRCIQGFDLDLNSVTGRMVAKILAAVSEQEGELRNERWWSAVFDNRQRGEFPHSGPRMYGWEREKPHKLVASEAKWVREVARRLLRNESMNSVLHDINARGARTSSGKPWTATSMRNYLLNPRVAGYATYDREILYDDDGQPRRGTWKPILEPDTWEVLAAMLRSRSRKAYPRVALLGGIVVCGLCGRKMITGSRAQRGGTVRTYRCNDGAGHGGCGKLSTVAEPLELTVQHAVISALADPKVLAAVGAVQEEHEDEGLRDQLAALRARRAQNEAALDDPNAESPEVLTRSVARLTTQIKRLEKELAASRTTVTPDPVKLPTSEADWPADLASRRAIIDRLVAAVVLEPATTRGRPTFDDRRVRVEWQPQVPKGVA